jgi:hypothetical protein
MATDVIPGRDTYRTLSSGHWVDLHRCEDCWRSKIVADDQGNRVADNNGFTPADRRYPHAAWCPNRGAF